MSSRLGPPSAAAACLLLSLSAMPARAVPSFAEQTGQPCAACHVGAFGPQLKPYGRQFKLYGYTSTTKKQWTPPVAVTAQTSFTNTQAAQPGGAARWFAPNNNFALDQASLYYAGRIDPHTGGFIELMYDGVTKQLQPGNIDIRHVREFTLFGEDAVGGVTVNNSPTVQDVWNSTPVWGFPYNRSALAPTPAQATLIDGALGQRVAGLGGYVQWNDLIYGEVTAYRGLGRDVLNATGIVPVADAPAIDGFVPYWRLAVQQDFDRHSFEIGTYGLNASLFPNWRLAVQQDFDRHSFEIGTYGLNASLFPNGDRSAGTPDTYTDLAVDANYQFIADPHSVVSDMLSVHGTIIRESQWLGSSNRLLGSNRNDRLATFRADVSYSFAATVTPSLQLFQTAGSADAVQFNTPSGRPNSAGMIAEIAYVPWGKPDSPVRRVNLRLAAQYVAYATFDGSSHAAAGNNALYLSVWGAIGF